MNVFTKRIQKRKQKRLKRKSLEDGTAESAAWPAGFNGYHHCGSIPIRYRYDPGSRGRLSGFLQPLFLSGSGLLGLASVCFPGPR